MCDSRPGGKKQFSGVFCSWIVRYEVSQQADAFILGREKKDRGGFLVLSHPGESGCKASSDKSWLQMFYQVKDQPLLGSTGFESIFLLVQTSLLLFFPGFQVRWGSQVPGRQLDACLGCSCPALTATRLKKINSHANLNGT